MEKSSVPTPFESAPGVPSCFGTPRSVQRIGIHSLRSEKRSPQGRLPALGQRHQRFLRIVEHQVVYMPRPSDDPPYPAQIHKVRAVAAEEPEGRKHAFKSIQGQPDVECQRCSNSDPPPRRRPMSGRRHRLPTFCFSFSRYDSPLMLLVTPRLHTVRNRPVPICPCHGEKVLGPWRRPAARLAPLTGYRGRSEMTGTWMGYRQRSCGPPLVVLDQPR